MQTKGVLNLPAKVAKAKLQVGNLQRESEGLTGRAEVRVALRSLTEALRASVQGGREASKDDRVSMKDTALLNS